MSLSWYIQRIKTFSAGEVLFRVKQRVRTHVLDKRIYKRILAQSSMSLAETELPNSRIIADPEKHFEYPIFKMSVDIFKPIDWHLDVSSGKRFPEKFSHSINIRSDEFGSAKHVWEVNRMLFLTHIAKLYHESNDEKYWELFCYHLTSWKNENPYLMGVNWYGGIELAIRLINWYYCWKLFDVDTRLERKDVRAFVDKVWMPLIELHVDFLCVHPSLCSSANNHLVAEYVGIFVACCKWTNLIKCKQHLKYAKCGLEREILLQNSSEGVNREEAAEYIQFIDDFFLIAAIVGRDSGEIFSKVYNERLHAMARYMNVMLDAKWNYPMYGDGDDGFVLRPDAGGLFNNFRSLLSAFAAYFEDASLKRQDAEWDEKCSLLLGVAGCATFDALASAADVPLEKNHFYTESGHYYFRKRIGEHETYLHFDAAPLGFLSIAAHGHADALSFILHVDGQPILVDSGTFTYHTHKEWRRYFVGTISHNTIRINGKNQANQAGPTMWLKHYHCKTLNVGENFVEATHNGYVSAGVIHRRKIEFSRDKDEFVVIDTFDAKSECEYTIEIPFHLHPNVKVSFLKSEADGVQVAEVHYNEHLKCFVRIQLPAGLNFEVVRGNENAILGWYSDHFGEKKPTSVIYGKMQAKGIVRLETRIQVISQ